MVTFRFGNMRWLQTAVYVVTLCFVSLPFVSPRSASLGYQFNSNCFFRVAKSSTGVSWLVDPNGNPFYFKGVDNINWWGDNIRYTSTFPYHEAVLAKYGPNATVWAQSVVSRAASWGYNVVGPWSSTEANTVHILPYTPILSFADSLGGGLTGTFPDIFDEATWIPHVTSQAMQMAPYINDPYLLGYFLDNELHWGPISGYPDSVLTGYLSKFQTSSPAYTVASNWLKSKYNNNITAFNIAWGTSSSDWLTINASYPFSFSNPNLIADSNSFVELVALQYYNTTTTILRKVDPNHLILGHKVAGGAPDAVWSSGKGFIDVQSVDIYNIMTPGISSYIQSLVDLSNGLPLLIAEFGYTGNDSGLPNSVQRQVLVPTQADRALQCKYYMQNITLIPGILGGSWFEHTDEPAQGRFDGEDDNWGVVNITDSPYEDFVNGIQSFYFNLDALHGSSEGIGGAFCVAELPCPLDCSGNGCCNHIIGQCVCNQGFSGYACEQNFAQIDITNFGAQASQSMLYYWSGWTAGQTDFNANQASVGSDGSLIITLDNVGCPGSCGGVSYVSTGVQFAQPSTFGTYTWTMIGSGVSGVINYIPFIQTGNWITGVTITFETINCAVDGGAPTIMNCTMDLSPNASFTGWKQWNNIVLPKPVTTNNTYTMVWTNSSIQMWQNEVSVWNVDANFNWTSGYPFPNYPAPFGLSVQAPSNLNSASLPATAMYYQMGFDIEPVENQVCTQFSPVGNPSSNPSSSPSPTSKAIPINHNMGILLSILSIMMTIL